MKLYTLRVTLDGYGTHEDVIVLANDRSKMIEFSKVYFSIVTNENNYDYTGNLNDRYAIAEYVKTFLKFTDSEIIVERPEIFEKIY